MNTILWILQAFVAFSFLYSGFCKTVFPVQKLVSMGQTGVENLPLPFTRFIGTAEVLGAIGILLPEALQIFPIVTAISALCFAFVMVPAAFIHYKRKEPKNVGTNVGLFLLCLFIAYGRLFLVK